jgi:hypothetical protein
MIYYPLFFSRRILIVNDIFGIFALIIFPFSSDSGLISESHKYQFNSLKLVERQILNQK